MMFIMVLLFLFLVMVVCSYYSSNELLIWDSGSNSHVFDEIYHPKNESDILTILDKAAVEQKTISLWGSQHSMGGQILGGNYGIDLKNMNKIELINSYEYVAGCGATWCEVIEYLDKHKLSPKTLQGYCSFSVGGTVGVNALGSLTDFTIGESIIAIKVAMPPTPHKASYVAWTYPGDKLFKHVVGGYGLFGVILEVRLKAVGNHCYNEDVPFRYISWDDLSKIKHREDADDVRMFRVDPLSMNVLMVHFKNMHDCRIPLPKKPLEESVNPMTTVKHYLIGLPGSRKLRNYLENKLDRPLDFKYGETTRNVLAYTAAANIKQNTGLIWRKTHILNEYFVQSIEEAHKFIRYTKELLEEYEGFHFKLLNISLRYVIHDNVSALPYAQVDCIALVYYFRVSYSHLSVLEDVTSKLIVQVLKQKGSFYLPYKKVYTIEQFHEAYGKERVDSFEHYKREVDPFGILINSWYNKYYLQQ